MGTIALLLVGLAMTCSAALAGDAFQKWQTQAGTLYIGDRPPAGSVLVERVEFGSAGQATPEDPASELADAARQGREIMRLRAEAREAERNRELERELRAAVGPAVDWRPPLVIVGGGHHHRSRIGIGPSPISAVTTPDIRLVTPDFSAMSYAPAFRAPAPSGRGRHDR